MAIIGAQPCFESGVGAILGLSRHRDLSDCRIAIIFADKWEFIYKLFLYTLGVTPFIRKKKRPKVVESA